MCVCMCVHAVKLVKKKKKKKTRKIVAEGEIGRWIDGNKTINTAGGSPKALQLLVIGSR